MGGFFVYISQRNVNKPSNFFTLTILPTWTKWLWITYASGRLTPKATGRILCAERSNNFIKTIATMKIAKIIFAFLVVYTGLFAIWLMFVIACSEYSDGHGQDYRQCSDNALTRVIRTTHAPVIRLLSTEAK